MRATRYATVQKWRKANPEKCRAYCRVQRARKSGKLKQLPCQYVSKHGKRCNNPDTQAHHEDYSKPLEVLWFLHLPSPDA